MMTPIRVALAGLALAAAAFPAAALAQAGAAAPAASAGPHKVGLVDMAFIFSKYKKLDTLREQLKKDFETSSADGMAMQKQIQEIEATLKSGTIKKDSPQWAEMEQKFVELNAQLRLKSTTLNREFAKKEAMMYKEVYEEVTALVQKYAEYHRYTLVLRYQRDADEEGDDASKIIGRMNQLVVYHQTGDDMTDRVLEVLNRPFMAAGAATVPAAVPVAGRPAASPR